MWLKPIIPWATEVTYPAGPNPWNGQPLSVAPGTDYFEPKKPAPAQYFNYLLASNAVQAALLQEYALAGALTNWTEEFKIFSTYTTMGLAWDPYLNFWLMFQSIGPTAGVIATKGLDAGTVAGYTVVTGANFSTAANPVYGACCIDPSTPGQYVCAYTDDTATHNFINIWQVLSGTWTQEYTSGASGGYFYGVELATIGTTTVVMAVASTDAHSGIIWTTSISGGSWPAPAWPPAIQFQPFGIAAMNAGDTVNVKSNGAQVVVIANTTASGGLTVWSGSLNLAETTLTWSSSSSLASAAIALFAGGKCVGLCWTQDAVGLCWLAAVQHGVTTTFFRSADGITWTEQEGGLAATNQKVVDMAAAGSHVFCTLIDSGSTVPALLPGAMFSVDGGITWYPSQLSFTTNTATVSNANRPRVASSSLGFVVANAIWQRFSEPAGLPPAEL